MANGAGYALEHRLVMAKALGRFLETDEHVHHVNLDPTDNRLDNLALVTPSQHARIHALIRKGVDPISALAMS